VPIIDFIQISQYLTSHFKPVSGLIQLEGIDRFDIERYSLKRQKSIEITYNKRTRKLTIKGSIGYFMQGHNFTYDNSLFAEGLKIIGAHCGMDLFGFEVEIFEFGSIIHTDMAPKEIIAKHSVGDKLLAYANPKYKGYFKYFEDSNVRIKMYDVGRNPLNKLSKPIGEIVSEIGWHPKDNYLKVEAHYKRPERSFGQLSVKDLTNPDCQQIFKRDLYSQYKRLEPMKSIIYPTNKKDLSSIDIVLIELAETLINNGKSLNEIKRALYNRINSFSDEEWKKTDKDSRKRQIKARIGKLRVAENSKWDLSEELKNALFSEK
jgi:hypothetical protein